MTVSGLESGDGNAGNRKIGATNVAALQQPATRAGIRHA